MAVRRQARIYFHEFGQPVNRIFSTAASETFESSDELKLLQLAVLRAAVTRLPFQFRCSGNYAHAHRAKLEHFGSDA
jgi:hypothetical protein